MSATTLLHRQQTEVGPFPIVENDPKIKPKESLNKVRLDSKIKYVAFFMGCTMLYLLSERETIVKSLEWGSSPLDWCEANFDVHNSVAEFWNTVSSLFMCLTALVGPMYYMNTFHHHEPNMYMVWVLMMFVGLGSCYFHGSLSIAGQVLDELPITLINFFGLAVTRPMHKWGKSGWRQIVFDWPFFVCAIVGCTAVCLVHPIVSHVICVTCIPISIYSFSMEYKNCADRERIAPMFRSAVIWFTLAFGSWILDRVACEPLTLFFSQELHLFGDSITIQGFYPQLHAWWHVFISGCFWSLVSLGVAIRVSGDRKARVCVHYVSPMKFFPVTGMEEV